MHQILITNGGPHPASKWAMTTANVIVDPSALEGDKAIAAEKLKLCVAEILEPLHALNQDEERNRILREPAIINQPYRVTAFAGSTLERVLKVTDDSPWKEHFRREEVQSELRSIITKHFSSAQLIERQWYADSHPDCPHAQTFQTASIDKGIA